MNIGIVDIRKVSLNIGKVDIQNIFLTIGIVYIERVSKLFQEYILRSLP